MEVRRLGRVGYADGLALQRALVEDRRAGRVDDLLLLLEHPHVLTLGVRGDRGRSHILVPQDLLDSRGVEVHETGRGGDITYHGPGQIVGYPILDLRPDRCDVHRYVRDLEEVLIRVAADFGVTASRVEGLTGVWVGRNKLAAIGVRIARWITSHGFALNVSTDLDYFNLIVPCGIADRGVTSLARLLGRPIDRVSVEDRIAFISPPCSIAQPHGVATEGGGAGVSSESTLRWIRPTRVTIVAATATLAVMAFSVAFLAVRYPGLPDLLPVRFNRLGVPNGWQFKTIARVLMPALVQTALALTLGSIGALVLSRSHGTHDRESTDVRAAAVAAEYVALMTFIWVAFQAYAAVALVRMWEREGGGLGREYMYVELLGIVLTVIVALRARQQFGRPTERPFVAEHWRFGQLYKNPGDPALFVPTRDGSRWTLNFGRPVAVLMMAVILGIGIIGPTVILGLLLR